MGIFIGVGTGGGIFIGVGIGGGMLIGVGMLICVGIGGDDNVCGGGIFIDGCGGGIFIDDGGGGGGGIFIGIDEGIFICFCNGTFTTGGIFIGN